MKTASELDLSEKQYRALITTLELMESGKLEHTDKVGFQNRLDLAPKDGPHRFNMSVWIIPGHGCGTVGCIGGTAEMLAGEPVFDSFEEPMPPTLDMLFYPILPPRVKMSEITIAEATAQLRKCLETGSHDWEIKTNEDA